MTVEELQVLITADTNNLRKEIQKTNGLVAGLQKQATKTSGSIFGAVLKGNIATGLLVKGMSLLTQNMDSAVDRLDALNNFPRVMSNLGVNSEDAEASMKRLSDALIGLPTTLDEATLSVQRFTSANGNVKASTEMFLALDNAILAGGANAQVQSSALEQLSQAYAKGKPDMMEWRTAMTAMPAQLKQVAIAMGYVDASQLGEDLRNGNVSMNEFMKKIIELNHTGANGFKSFEEQARNSTGGVRTSIINVKTALTRGLADIMNAIGQSNIAGFFQGIARAISAVIPYVVAVIKVIATAVSFISGLFGRSKKVTPTINKASSSLKNLGSSGASSSKGLDKATGSAKKLKKELNGLASFDEMNVLQEPADNSGGGGGGDAGGGGVGDLGDIDLSGFDKLSTGADKADEIYQKIMNGFKKLGEYINTFDFSGIIGHVKGIGTSLKEIFTDPQVIASAQNWAITVVNTLKSLTTDVIQIGINITEGFVGSIDNYLSQNKGRIKNFISSMFDISGTHLNYVSMFGDALADISSVFKSGQAKQIGADIIAIFANPLMSAVEIIGKFCNDLEALFVIPIVDNVDKIKTAMNNTLAPLQTVFDTVSEMATYVGDSLNTLYDQHLAPFFKTLTKGISDTFGKFLTVYNEHIAPFVDKASKRFKELWDSHLKPLWDNIVDFIGSVIGYIQLVYEKSLKPFIDWVIQNVVPVIVPILDTVGSAVSTVFSIIVDIISGIIKTISGLLKFVTGVFSGDWKKAWEGIKQAFSAPFEAMKSIIKSIMSHIKTTVNNAVTAIKNTVSGMFNTIKTKFSSLGSTIGNAISKGVKGAINGVLSLIEGRINSAINIINGAIRLINKLPGVSVGQLSSVKLPRLARGGIVDKPTLAQIGENGREAIMPLERNTSWISDLADKIDERMGGSNGQPIQLVVKIGEDTLLDKVIDGIQDKNFETNGGVFNL